MSIIINGTEIQNIVFNGVELDTVKFNNVIVFNKIKLINFTGIDKNGNLETDEAYDGVPVEYAVNVWTMSKSSSIIVTNPLKVVVEEFV